MMHGSFVTRFEVYIHQFVLLQVRREFYMLNGTGSSRVNPERVRISYKAPGRTEMQATATFDWSTFADIHESIILNYCYSNINTEHIGAYGQHWLISQTNCTCRYQKRILK